MTNENNTWSINKSNNNNKSNHGNNAINNKQKSKTKIYKIVTKQIHLPS